MAGQDKEFRNTFTSSARAKREARQSAEEYYAQREVARTILSPDEVAGDYDAARTLFTTLDGKARPITYNDLKIFRANVQALKRKYKGGITAKQVIDLSLQADRDRATKEIHTGLPITTKAGVVQFQTNAGPKSDVVRHYVAVQFLDFEAVVSSPMPAAKIVKQLTEGRLNFDCDCGRHRYWYRYVATIGKFNYGPSESGFPKVRNPKLVGVACKHVLRVMTNVRQSPTIKQFLVNLIEQARANVRRKEQAVTVAQMKALAAAQAGEKRLKTIKTSEQKKAARQATPSYQKQQREREARAKAVEKAGEIAKRIAERNRATRDAAAARRQVELNVKKLLSLKAINQQQADAMLAALRKG